MTAWALLWTNTARAISVSPCGFKSENLPWEYRPHALFVAYAPHDAPRYALSLVVEHGNAGSEAAAPVARDIMAATLARDPANRVDRPRVAEGRGT